MAAFLPEFAQGIVINLIGQDCFQTLLVDFNPDPTCLKLTLSKILGLAIVAGGVLVKVPQIQTILNKRSVQGLSLLGNLLELLSYTVSVAYNYRNQYNFSTYGEGCFLTVQDIIIVFLLFYYSSNKPFLPVYLILYPLLCYALFFGLIDMEQLAWLQRIQVGVVIASKIPQIYINFKNGSTGQLSAVTVFLFAGGSLARIFTTLQEVNDINILAGFVLATVMNLILAFQVIYYWGAKPAKGSSASPSASSSSSQTQGKNAKGKGKGKGEEPAKPKEAEKPKAAAETKSKPAKAVEQKPKGKANEKAKPTAAAASSSKTPEAKPKGNGKPATEKAKEQPKGKATPATASTKAPSKPVAAGASEKPKEKASASSSTSKGQKDTKKK